MSFLGGASIDTLMRRVEYGGRKGRSAVRRLNGLTLVHPSGGRITFRCYPVPPMLTSINATQAPGDASE